VSTHIPAVRVQGLVKRCGTHAAVDGIDLTVEAGGCFGILGPNGAGKTTLMRMITCVSPPTEGTLEVLGVDVRGDRRALKRRLGVVPQGETLDADLTVVENLTSFAAYHDVPRRQAAQRARELLAFAQLEDRGTARVEELSGGMKRRLLIARALVNDPELVVLDEPTTGLDPLVQQEFQNLLRELQAEGRTVFLSSHTLTEVERVADRVAIIREGRLVVTESVQALKQKAVRRLEFEFASPVAAEPFEVLANVQSAESRGTVVALTIAGPVGEAVMLAARHELLNVVSAEPDLEELFLAYYRPAQAGVSR
jgi:ABC-type multidrug transport system ATPase subunit